LVLEALKIIVKGIAAVSLYSDLLHKFFQVNKYKMLKRFGSRHFHFFGNDLNDSLLDRMSYHY